MFKKTTFFEHCKPAKNYACQFFEQGVILDPKVLKKSPNNSICLHSEFVWRHLKQKNNPESD